MGLTGTDLALTTARVARMRVAAGRVGFVTDDVEGAGTPEPGEISWHEIKPEDDGEEWNLVTVWSMCSEPPVASFTDAPDPTTPGTSVTFTDTSTPTGEITFWHWEFGDGATSSDQNPTHAYAAVGTYTVRLWIASPTGSDMAEGTVTVEAPPEYSVQVRVVIDGVAEGLWPTASFDLEIWKYDTDDELPVLVAPAGPDWTLVDTVAISGGDTTTFTGLLWGVYSVLATVTDDGGLGIVESEMWTSPGRIANETPEILDDIMFSVGGGA